MSVATFPPRKDEQLLAWSANFIAKLQAAPPETFGLTAQQIATFSDLQASFAHWHEIATNVNTNSRANVGNKDVARRRLLDDPGGAWELVNIIQMHPGTTDFTRNELALRRTNGRSPAPIPATPPEMSIEMMLGRRIKVRLRDIAHPDKRGKPENIFGAAVLYCCGDEPEGDLTKWHFAMNASKPIFDVELPLWIAAGSKVWITARWFNKKMQSGPPALPKSVRACDAPARLAA